MFSSLRQTTKLKIETQVPIIIATMSI